MAPLARDQLGRHERGSALQNPLTREDRRVLPWLILDDPEVQHLQIVVLGSEPRDEQVGGLDITVHEPVLMRFGERPARLAQEHRDPLGGLRSEPGDDLVQVETLEQLHDVVEAAAVVHAEIVELHGVRRAQAGGHLRFALEAPHELFLRQTGPRVVANELHGRGTSQEPVLPSHTSPIPPEPRGDTSR